MDKTNKSDGFWWLLTAILGSVVCIVPIVFKFSSTEENNLLYAAIFLFFLGVVIGFLRPTRPWRWGIASVLLLPFTEFVYKATLSSEIADQSFSLISNILNTVVTIPIYALIALPAILGTFIGSYITKIGSQSENKHKSYKNKLPWILGLTLGFLVSGISSFIAPVYEMNYLFPYWIVGLFLASLTMGIIFPKSVWRWGIAVGLGLPIFVILKIIIDISSDQISHDLFPFEIIIALFTASIASFPGVYLGTLVNKLFEKFKIVRKSEDK